MPVNIENIEPGIALLRVNRPQVRNALNLRAMRAFVERVEQAHSFGTDLRVLILSGAGDSFITGGDLKELRDHPDEADGLHLSQLMGNALKRLEALPCPTIAAINGPARGGGAEIALACDLRVMSADADLGLVQVTLGLTPGWGAAGRLLRLLGYSRAMELLLTGRVLSAEEALSIGLANQVASPGKALDIALELARQISAQPLATVYAIKRILRAYLVLPPNAAAALEQAEFPPLWAAEDHWQAVDRFLKRKRR